MRERVLEMAERLINAEAVAGIEEALATGAVKVPASLVVDESPTPRL
jgi:hypothetical protein